MAKTDFLEEIAKKPLHIQLAILAGILTAFGFLYYQFFYTPMSEEFRTAKSKNKQLVEEASTLRKRKKRLDELIKQRDQLQETLRKNRVALPTGAELPAFFLHLQKQAASSGVNVRTWKRARERPVGQYVKVPVNMTITGTFYQINHYFKLLAQTDRIITVENLSLGGGKMQNGEMIMRATFVAATFRLKDGAKFMGGAPPKAKKKKKKSKVGEANKKRAKDLAEKSGEKIEGGGDVAKPEKVDGKARMTGGAGGPQ